MLLFRWADSKLIYIPHISPFNRFAFAHHLSYELLYATVALKVLYTCKINTFAEFSEGICKQECYHPWLREKIIQKLPLISNSIDFQVSFLWCGDAVFLKDVKSSKGQCALKTPLCGYRVTWWYGQCEMLSSHIPEELWLMWREPLISKESGRKQMKRWEDSEGLPTVECSHKSSLWI